MALGQVAGAPFLQGDGDGRGPSTAGLRRLPCGPIIFAHAGASEVSDLSALRVEMDWPLSYKSRSGAGKMERRIRVLSTKPKDPSSIPWNLHSGRRDPNLVS